MLGDALSDLENLRVIAALRQSSLAYPLVNALHVVGIALLFGAIVPLDLRLAGWRAADGALGPLSRVVLPVAVFGFVLAACAGLLLFATDARAYAASPLFQAKLILIALALLNAFWLRRIDWRNTPTNHTRIAGISSLLLWLGVILLGRLIGYF